MPKISSTAKSLLLPLFLLVGLLGARKYVYEFGTGANQILPVDQGRFYLFDDFLQYNIDCYLRDTGNIMKQMIASKHQDSLEIQTSLSNIQKEAESSYSISEKIRGELVKRTGGRNEVGYYKNFAKRLKIQPQQIRGLYGSLRENRIYYYGKPLIYIDLIADHKGRTLELEDFIELYDDAPLVVHFLNLNGFELKMAHLEQEIVLHLAKEKGIILK